MGVANMEQFKTLDLANSESRVVQQLWQEAGKTGTEERVFLHGGGRVLSVWGASAGLGPAWDAVSRMFPERRAEMLEKLHLCISWNRGELTSVIYSSVARSEIEVEEDQAKLDSLRAQVRELEIRMQSDTEEIKSMNSTTKKIPLSQSVPASEGSAAPSRRLSFYKIVFGKPSMVVYSAGVNSQNAHERACETLLNNTGNDYRRVPSVTYELGNLSLKERSRLLQRT